ncbi:MAG: FAD:protein FMN transferase [Actinomycetia bacterium]|nr:FAD:protein FMN transferase [Actinomycetes bacterium]
MIDRSPFRFEHHGLLGTVIDVRVVADDQALADRVDEVMVAEITRLEGVFSAYDDDSELCRWRRGDEFVPSPEFAELLGRVLDWQARSDGGFNPLIGELTSLWHRAEALGTPPQESDLAHLAASIQRPRYSMVDGVPVAEGDCSGLNFNAIAKGYIVDRALGFAPMAGVAWVCVNAGGDMAHRGSGVVRAGIENPHRPYDNEPPLMVVELTDAALATSGIARRGFRVAGRWFGHVLDPRTGWPVDEIASISVLAGDAMTADVFATVAGVMAPTDAIEFASGIDGVEVMIIDRDRRLWATTGWQERVLS